MRILLVEDNPGDARLIRAYLSEAGTAAFELAQVDRLAEAVRRVGEADFDVVLLDLSLPDASGLETVKRMQQAAATRPIVVLTGLNDEAVALEALRNGAQDYLTKGQINGELLVRAMRYAIERKHTLLELQQLNDFKNTMLGMAAHDLRNPLAVVITCSDFLLSPESVALSPEQRAKFLGRIKANSEFMFKLIDDLLDVTKIESGRLDLKLEHADLRRLTEATVAFNQVLAGKKGIRLNFTPECDLPPFRFDRVKIEQVLNNLISNALKFSEPGTAVTIRVRASGANGPVIVSVADQGPGIPAQELDKLFKPFSKTSVRSTAGEGSTGLGLAISRKIVEGHGGRIWAESEVGNGTTFSFSLPGSHAGRAVPANARRATSNQSRPERRDDLST
jgi:two-component system sensor histidine kinase/response regulator